MALASASVFVEKEDGFGFNVDRDGLIAARAGHFDFAPDRKHGCGTPAPLAAALDRVPDAAGVGREKSAQFGHVADGDFAFDGVFP